MNWRDLLYFSKGERRALTLLLCLITIAGILLLVYDHNKDTVPLEAKYIIHPENAPKPIAIDTTINIPNKTDDINKTEKSKKNTNKTNRKTYTPYKKSEKFTIGTIVELNTADTTTLKKVPGIGSVYARRIVKYRELLGGFYKIDQLKEVYGMDEERYQSLKNWFHVDRQLIAKLPVNYLPLDSIVKHPYLNYRQALAICRLCIQKGKLTGWENLQLMEEFSEQDKERLKPYLLF